MRHAPDIDHTYHPEDGAGYNDRLSARDDAMEEYRGREDEVNAYVFTITYREAIALFGLHDVAGVVAENVSLMLGSVLTTAAPEPDFANRSYDVVVSGAPVEMAHVDFVLRHRARTGYACDFLPGEWQGLAACDRIGYTSREVPAFNERRERKTNVEPFTGWAGDVYFRDGHADATRGKETGAVYLTACKPVGHINGVPVYENDEGVEITFGSAFNEMRDFDAIRIKTDAP